MLKSWWHISRKKITCFLFGISIKILLGGGDNYIDFFFYFRTEFKERNLQHFLCYIRFYCDRIRLTYPDIESLCEMWLQKQKRDFVNLPADRILIGVRTLNLQTICLFLNIFIYTLNMHLVSFKENAGHVICIYMYVTQVKKY